MMEGIRGYFLAIVAACMLAVLACALLKNSKIQRITKFIAGILILLTVATPLLRIDTAALAERISELGRGSRFDTQEISKDYQTMLRALVKKNTQTYIEEKAQELGGIIQAEVTVGSGEYPAPEHVVLTGTMTPEQQEWKLYG